MSSTGPSTDGPDAGSASEFEALQTVITALRPIGVDGRVRILVAAATFLGTGGAATFDSQVGPSAVSGPHSRPPFSRDTSMSPKEFLLEKHPRTDVERVACLGYYLTHYLDQPHFKTLDLSKLNTEAAQPKFSNTAQAVNNALRTGYIVPSTKGNRQLSASGEQFVLALPDREAASAAMAARPRRRTKRVATRAPAARARPST
jgi:hypothetical protein